MNNFGADAGRNMPFGDIFRRAYKKDRPDHFVQSVGKDEAVLG